MSNTKDNKIEIQLSDFGPFAPFVEDVNVTDIDYENNCLWITDLTKGVYQVKDIEGLTPEFILRFSHFIADRVNRPFNPKDNVLEAETDTLRIEIVHESVSQSGRSIVIRKTPAMLRMNPYNMTTGEHKYVSEEILMLLANCVAARLNIACCGKPGVGKTELLKTLTTYINQNDKVITIEDNPEIHYNALHPGRFCQEMKINTDNFDYDKAIKTSMRLNPIWLCLSEARSREVTFLIEAWSTGVSGMTTLHTEDVRKVPDRIQSMAGMPGTDTHMQNIVYESLDVGILIRRKFDSESKKIYRYIDQICFYSREDQNKIYMIVDDGKLVSKELPKYVLARLERENILDPFYNEIVHKQIQEYI